MFNVSITEDEIIIEVGYQIIVPLLIGLAMTSFLLNSIILVSILSSKLLMRTRSHDNYINIIISMVGSIFTTQCNTNVKLLSENIGLN